MIRTAPPYDEDKGTGSCATWGAGGGTIAAEVLVTVVTKSGSFPASKQFCRELVKRCPYVTRCAERNMRKTNVILGPRSAPSTAPLLSGHPVGGLSSAFPANPSTGQRVQTEVLYLTAVELAGLTAGRP